MNKSLNKNSLSKWHPISIYFQEKHIIVALLEELSVTFLLTDLPKFTNVFNQLQTIEKRFARKENQLFPFFRKKRLERAFARNVVFS